MYDVVSLIKHIITSENVPFATYPDLQKELDRASVRRSLS